jgi:hypothetical protein
MNAPTQIPSDDDRRKVARTGVGGRGLDTAAEVGRKVRAGADRANRLIGEFWRLGFGWELGRDAAADYSEQKTFHVHDGPRAHRRLAPGVSA